MPYLERYFYRAREKVDSEEITQQDFREIFDDYQNMRESMIRLPTVLSQRAKNQPVMKLELIYAKQLEKRFKAESFFIDKQVVLNENG